MTSERRDDMINNVIITLRYRQLYVEEGLDALVETVRENHIPELAKIIIKRVTV